jgi:hypothetical protein
MAMAINPARRFVLLGSSKGLTQEALPPSVSVCRDRAEIEETVSRSAKAVTWVSFTRSFTDILLEKAVDLRVNLRGAHLITLTPPRSESIPALLGLFHPVFGLIEEFRWLPKAELIDVLTRGDASDRFIGGSADVKAKTLTLLRGNLETVIAPFSIFSKSGDGTVADFTRLGLSDHGRTVVLGDYEASADAILYELDPDYRRTLNKQRRQTDRSFGASLMRLRKQRRLKRSDFLPICSKEIARIERNEIAKPHSRTLDVIAGRLGIEAGEIPSF